MMNEEQAVQKLLTMVDWETFPALTVDELKDCLRTHQRAKLWTAETEFSCGDRVVSPTYGRMYECVVGGVSGTISPFGYTNRMYSTNHGFGDGLYGVVWRDCGKAPKEIYSLNGAANAAWKRKAAKCAGLVNVQDKDVKINYEALQKQCLKQAAQYLPAFVR